MMVFSKEKFLEDIGGAYDGTAEEEWVEACDGNRVYCRADGVWMCVGNDGIKYKMDLNWCNDIDWNIMYNYKLIMYKNKIERISRSYEHDDRLFLIWLKCQNKNTSNY